MELYYKDYLHLIENENIKFSTLIIEILQDVFLPQSSQLSSSYLSQTSLIRSPPPSSLPRSNLLSVQTLSQSSSSHSLSATALTIIFNPKCQNLLLNFPTAPPKLRTLTASPPFRQIFSSPLKTTFDQIRSAKPTKFITSPTSASSSSDTPRSSQLKFQPPSSIPLPLQSTVTSPCTPTFPSSPTPTPTAPSSFSAPASTSCHHLVPHPPSKVLPATPGFSLYVECKYHLLP